jgi:hypothetical protein
MYLGWKSLRFVVFFVYWNLELFKNKAARCTKEKCWEELIII